jgi:hypothetical protein
MTTEDKEDILIAMRKVDLIAKVKEIADKMESGKTSLTDKDYILEMAYRYELQKVKVHHGINLGS